MSLEKEEGEGMRSQLLFLCLEKEKRMRITSRTTTMDSTMSLGEESRMTRSVWSATLLEDRPEMYQTAAISLSSPAPTMSGGMQGGRLFWM